MDIEERLKELRDMQNKILVIIRNNQFTVDNIIDYGNELKQLSIRIDELNSLLWESTDSQ